MAFRDGPFENLKVPLAWTAAVAAAVGIALALMLLLDAGGENDLADPARTGFEAAAAPASGALAAPVRWTGSVVDYVKGYFFAVSENRRLRRRLVELEAWRTDAIAMSDVNERYEAMLGLQTQPAMEMITARSISESRGPFANARLLDAGSGRGVRVGYPVVTEHGLVGRIVGTGGGVSRMLTLTDVASRTPVLIDRTDARAFLSGDGSGNPRLEFIRGDNAVQPGDRILTSGDGGNFPRGLPVGVAARGVDGTWRVRLYSDHGAVDLVRILMFQDFGQLVDPAALEAPPLSALPPSPTAPAPIQGATP